MILAEEPITPPIPPAHPSRTASLRQWLAYSDDQYKVGTLTYTRLGLLLIFLYLLSGDLVWVIMEMIFPTSMPLQLERLGVGKEWIGYMMGTAAACINMTLVPVISFRSDRTRTRLGRRIPYILATMPFLCLFLAILGFSDDIGASLRASSWPAKLHLSTTTSIILLLGLMILLFNVFNVFVNSVYWYLFRDVIPTAFLGRFMAAFRMVGTVAAMIWGAFIYGHIETNTRSIYVGAALLYFVGFGLMCLVVKEGEYPPPADYDKSEPLARKIKHSIQTYARECFTHPLFITLYLSQALYAMGGACVMYRQFFYLRHLHFTTADMGKMTALMSPLVLAVQFPLGWLVDKIHPMRANLIATTAMVPIIFAGFFLKTYSIAGYTLNAFTLYIALSALQMPLLQFRDAADIPLLMRLFPEQQYGQFSSANAMLRHFSLIVGTIVGATFMGLMSREHGSFGDAYTFLWHGCFQSASAICLWIVYVYWKRAGAEKFVFDPEAVAAKTSIPQEMAL